MTYPLRSQSVTIPAYLQSLFAHLCQQSGFRLLHSSRQLDGLDDAQLMRKSEELALNGQSGSTIDRVRIVLRSNDGVDLTFTWGVFEGDLTSADTDFSPKPRFEGDNQLAGTPALVTVLTALAGAGFESLPASGQEFTIRFIRGSDMAGKVRLGIHVTLDYGAQLAGLRHERYS